MKPEEDAFRINTVAETMLTQHDASNNHKLVHLRRAAFAILWLDTVALHRTLVS